jgi:hypothetical protein
MMQSSVSIPFVNVNVIKCLCPRCPVQISSTCVNSKITVLYDALIKHPLQREDIPCVYCATGVATCPDIIVEKDCICGKCVIFPEYKLFNFEPNGHYCKNGSVK